MPLLLRFSRVGRRHPLFGMLFRACAGKPPHCKTRTEPAFQCAAGGAQLRAGVAASAYRPHAHVEERKTRAAMDQHAARLCFSQDRTHTGRQHWSARGHDVPCADLDRETRNRQAFGPADQGRAGRGTLQGLPHRGKPSHSHQGGLRPTLSRIISPCRAAP